MASQPIDKSAETGPLIFECRKIEFIINKHDIPITIN